jgi:ribosomal protein S18 acetylase RimI-like enzyme
MQARWHTERARRFLARIGGKPVAAATLVVIDGIARLANAATLPEARGMGAQAALIRTRLRAAAEAGLAVATSDARQGGGSLRNLARAGFTVCAQITQWSRSA